MFFEYKTKSICKNTESPRVLSTLSIFADIVMADFEINLFKMIDFYVKFYTRYVDIV